MRLITPQTIFTYTKVKKIIPNFLVRSVMYSFIYRIYVCVWLKYQLIFIIIKLKKNQLSTHFYCISVCLCFYIKRQNWKHQVSNCIKMYSAHFCMIFFFSWQSCQILLLLGTLAYFQSAMSPVKRGMWLSRFLILVLFIDLSLSFTAGSLMGVCTWVISL